MINVYPIITHVRSTIVTRNDASTWNTCGIYLRAHETLMTIVYNHLPNIFISRPTNQLIKHSKTHVPHRYHKSKKCIFNVHCIQDFLRRKSYPFDLPQNTHTHIHTHYATHTKHTSCHTIYTPLLTTDAYLCDDMSYPFLSRNKKNSTKSIAVVLETRSYEL